MVSLDARRIQFEPSTAVFVTKRIEDQGDLVRGEIIVVHQLVPAGQDRTYSFGAEGIVHPGSDIDRARVVKNAQLCLLAWRLAFVGERLDQLGNGSSRRPRCFIEPPIDRYFALSKSRMRNGSWIILRLGCLLCRDGGGEGEGERKTEKRAKKRETEDCNRPTSAHIWL